MGSTLTQGRDLIMASSGTLICIAFAALTFLCLSHGAPSPTGCDGQNHGIACCEYVEPDQTVFFTTGDNKAKGEKFVQKHQYVGSCRNTCKNLYPAAKGMTESKTQKYPGTSSFKCWCEFGEPSLDATTTGYKTCMFSAKTPIAAPHVAEAIVVPPKNGCDGKSHGIACCEYVEPDQTVFFTTGDNISKRGKFIQKHQYVGSCRNSCKNVYPAANGITVSKTQKYPGSSYFKCWCELGTPRLVARKTDKKTCMFSEKTPITRAQMNEVAAAPVAEALVVAPPVAPTPDPVRHYRE